MKFDGWVGRWELYGWVDRWVGGSWIGGWIDGWVDGWMVSICSGLSTARCTTRVFR